MKPSIMVLYYREERYLLASLMAECNSKVYILPELFGTAKQETGSATR